MGKHLTYEQRCQLHALYRQGMTQEAIATKIGSNQSVVSRELNRNQGLRGYRFKQAQKKTDERRKAASAPPRKMTPVVVTLIETKLREEQWSPEQISGWMQATQTTSVSHECIYRHIYADKREGGTLYKQLRRTGKKYNKRKGKTAGRGLIPNRIDIDERPAIVEQRSRIGDWEADIWICDFRHNNRCQGCFGDMVFNMRPVFGNGAAFALPVSLQLFHIAQPSSKPIYDATAGARCNVVAVLNLVFNANTFCLRVALGFKCLRETLAL